ncbi:hypothetical protein BQ8420_11835 [Nocardiopsis sp. JB363]|nr:hypothetical protein [Nocardiopsis sp. JB363]SIO86404.1 hypothetical protein BQ8420_11835 [Nocardiopsis sp. JB363]
MPLSGGLSPTDLSVFLHQWADYNGAENITELLDQEMILVPGGLRVVRVLSLIHI